MKILIDLATGILYADSVFISHVEVRHDNPPVHSDIEVRYSHSHGCDRVHADGIGWIGGHESDAVVLGRVRSGNGLLPCRTTEARLVGMVDRTQDLGLPVRLEMRHG